ncbi:unnamed protein product, partial [Phaeothamnion confervicola]
GIAFPAEGGGAVVAPVSGGNAGDGVVFRGHGGSRVLSLAVSPCRTLVATGDAAGAVVVWAAATGTVVTALSRSHGGPVVAAAFDKSGKKLAAVSAGSAAAAATVAVWESPSAGWRDAARLCRGEGDGSGGRPLFITWLDGACNGSIAGAGGSGASQLMTGGQNYATFWSLSPNLTSAAGDFGHHERQTLLCATALGGGAVAGTSAGT